MSMREIAINNPHGLSKVLEGLLIPNTKQYWGHLTFAAGITESNGNNILEFSLYTGYKDGDYDKKRIKSRSRMNVSKIREVIKEVLDLGPEQLTFFRIHEVNYFFDSSCNRKAELKYIITDKLIDELVALMAITIKKVPGK